MSNGSDDENKAESVSHLLGVPVLRHGTMKPGYACIRAIRAYFASLPQPIPDSALFIVGDRIFTDVILANRMSRYSRATFKASTAVPLQESKVPLKARQRIREGPLSIHVERIWKKDSVAIRYLENKLVNLVRRWNGSEVEETHALFVRN